MNFENKTNHGKGKNQKPFQVKETNTRIYRNEKPSEKEDNDNKILEKEFYESFKSLIDSTSNVSHFIYEPFSKLQELWANNVGLFENGEAKEDFSLSTI